MPENGNNSGEQSRQNAQNKKHEFARKVGEKVIKKAGKNGAKNAVQKKAMSMLLKFAPAIGYVLIAILILFIIIGLIAFFMMLPGLLADKLSGLYEAIKDFSATFEQGIVVDEDTVLNLAKYIEDMDYDLVSYGFVVPFEEEGYQIPETLEEAGYHLVTEENPNYKKNHLVTENKTNEEKDDRVNDQKYLLFYEKDDGTRYTSEEYFYYKDGNLYSTSTGLKKQSEDGTYLKNGITYNNDGTIKSLNELKADSVLYTYAIAEKRIYVMRNTLENTTLLQKFVGNARAWARGYSTDWAQGLLEFWEAEEGEATRYYDFWTDGSVEVTGKNKLECDGGWFNNPMTFDMTGWTGRYGLSTDFLISLHLATLSPDLVNTICQTFDTRAQIYLDHIEDGEVTAYFHTPEMVKTNGDGEEEEIFASWQDLDEIRDWWGVSKKEAKEIMDTYHIESLRKGAYACNGSDPTRVIFVSGQESNDVSTSKSLCYSDVYKENSGVNYYDNVFDNSYVDSKTSWGCESGAKTKPIFKVVSKSSDVPDDDDEQAYVVVKKDSDSELPSDISFVETDYWFDRDMKPESLISVLDMLNKYYGYIQNDYEKYNIVDREDGLMEEYKSLSEYPEKCPLNKYSSWDENPPEGYYNISQVIDFNSFKNFQEDKDTAYEFIIATWPTNDKGLEAGDAEYDPTEDSTIVLSLMARKSGADKNYDFAAVAYKKYSEKYKTEHGFTEEAGEETITCSQNEDKDECCSNCQDYIGDIVDGLDDINDEDYETYVPYIARVVGSWFRDTYFILPTTPDLAIEKAYDDYGDLYKNGDLLVGSTEVINNDVDFLQATGELWTKYIMDKKGYDYALFVINSDGSYIESEEELEEWKNKTKALAEAEGREIPQKIFDLVGSIELDSESETIRSGDNKVFYGYIDVYDGATEPSRTKSKEIEDLFIDNEISFIKRAETHTITSDDGAWSVYSFGESKNDNYIALEVNGDSPNVIQSVQNQYNENHEGAEENVFWYKFDGGTRMVTQNKDAQRGITNEKIKYLFKNKKYYKYDGTMTTAIKIRDDWNTCKNMVLELVYGTSNIDEISDSTPIANMAKDKLKNSRIALSNSVYRSDDASEAWQTIFTYISTGFNPFATYAIVNATQDMVRVYDINSGKEDILNAYIDEYYYEAKADKLDGYFGSKSLTFVRDVDNDKIAEIASPNYKNSIGTEVDGVKITQDTKFTYDPRDPNLISKVDLSKDGLAAFSILENTHTADADYAYRDFKELVCELDYFDKEDLIEPETNILEWILPETGSAGWPLRKYDKTKQYGTIIHSRAMYDTFDTLIAGVETSETIDYSVYLIEKYEAQIETYNGIISNLESQGDSSLGQLCEVLTFKADCYRELIKKMNKALDSELLDSSTTSDYKTKLAKYEDGLDEVKSYISDVNKKMRNSSSEQKVMNVNNGENKQSSSSTLNSTSNRVASRATSGSITVEYKEVSDPNMHCESTTIVNGVEYRNYKQNYAEWGTTPYSEGTMATSACGATSSAVILSGYGNTETAKDTADWLSTNCSGWETAAQALINCMSNYGVEATADYGASSYLDKIRAAWSEGKPVIANVSGSKRNGERGEMTSYGHYCVLLGETSEGVIVSEVASSDRTYIKDGHIYCTGDGTLETFDSNNPIKGVIIPNEAPTPNAKSSGQVQVFGGFDIGQSIVSPATAKIIEMGTTTVNNETSEELIEPLYIVRDEEADEEGATTENENEDKSDDGDETSPYKVFVTQSQKELIKLKADEMQLDPDNPFGESYTTGYIKLEVIGIESVKKIESYFGSDDSIKKGINAFYEDYYKTKLGKSICDSFTIYIEGIDFRLDQSEGASWDFENTILNKIITENEDEITFTPNEEIGEVTKTVKNYTPKEIPKYYPKAKQDEMQELEDDKAKMPNVIDFNDSKTGERQIYIKAGTLLGLCTNANITIIMKDKDYAIVENVEEYLEIEDLDDASNKGGSAITTDRARFFYIPYESGAVTSGATLVSETASSKEVAGVAVGICQWTTHVDGTCNGVAALCAFLYEQDSSLCKGLQAFGSMTENQIHNNLANIRSAFEQIGNTDYDRLLDLEFQYKTQEVQKLMDDRGVSWLNDRAPSLWGTYASVINWVPNSELSNGTSKWERALDESKSDEDNIRSLMKEAVNEGRGISDRWPSEARLAIELITGECSEEDLNVWLETAGAANNYELYEKYGSGKNPNYLN